MNTNRKPHIKYSWIAKRWVVVGQWHYDPDKESHVTVRVKNDLARKFVKELNHD